MIINQRIKIIREYLRYQRKEFAEILNIEQSNYSKIDLLEAGVSIEDVRGQADHSNLSVTSIYARHAKPSGSDKIRKLAREF